MQLRFRSILLVFAAGFIVAACSYSSSAQQAGSGASETAPAIVAPAAVPDAPVPQIELAAADPRPGQSQSTVQPAANSGSSPSAPGGSQNNAGPQGSSSSLTQQPGSQKSQHDTAAEQIKEQERQRVAGIVPAFNISYRWDAVSLTAGQKIGLAFRSATDPVTFAAGFFAAGYHEARDDDTGFGWGAEGYFKRSGAAYLDAFDGNIIGNGLLPSLLHQDPRYFRMGHGTIRHRLLYALAAQVVCRHDNTGKWEPKSKIGGNIIAGAISNLYYPSQNSGWGQTIGNGMVVTAEGGIGSLFQEFWPDISRKFLHRDPTHGLDAQAASRDSAPAQK